MGNNLSHSQSGDSTAIVSKQSSSTSSPQSTVMAVTKSATSMAAQQKDSFGKLQVPMHVQVAHFTPSTFPLVPVVTPHSQRLCQESWNYILGNKDTDVFGCETSGMMLFYKEFYERLDMVDTNGKFEGVLGQHGQNKVALKGAIIVRMVQMILSIQYDSDQTQFVLYMLGKSHAKKYIRPWQYSVFCQVILNTIASRLGTKATNNVMQAWVNVFAFALRSMLPSSIRNQVVENEVQVNTSSEFSSGKILNELSEAEDFKVLRGNFKAPAGLLMKGSRPSSAGSSHGNSGNLTNRSRRSNASERSRIQVMDSEYVD